RDRSHRPSRSNSPSCSWLPPQAIGEEGQTERLALFGMKLRASQIAPRHHRGHRSAVIRSGKHIYRPFGLEMIGMHEIGMQTSLARWNAIKKRMGMFHVNRVPADLRDLQGRV